MAQFKFSQISGPQFRMAVQQLAQRPFNIKVSYKIKKWIDAIDIEVKKIQEIYKTEVLEKFAEKNEDGTFKLTNPDDPTSHIILEANQAGIKKANDAFSERTCTIDRPKIILEELGDVDLPASVLGGLDPILTEQSELDAEKAATGLKAVPNS